MLLDIQKSPIQFLYHVQQAFGNFVHYKHGPAHVYLVNDPDLIRRVLVDESDKMDRPEVARQSYGKFLGNGLLVSAGEFHQRQRRAIQPLFNPDQIADYVPIMLDCIHEMANSWRDGESRDIAQDMSTLALNVVYETIFGTQPGQSRDELQAAMNTLQRYAGEMYRRTPQISEAECQKANEQFDKAFGELAALPRIYADQNLLSLLTNVVLPETGQPMSSRQVRDEVATFFAAGHETTATALTWVWYLLTQHPDVEAKVRAELGTVLNDRQPTVEDLPSLSLTTQVIKETLRLYPPAWILGRSPLEPIELNGYTVQPGATLVISPYVLHRNPDVFPDPERFDPDRFSADPPKYTYLPFGAGPHACIGQSFAMQEMTLVLATVIQQYHLELVPDQSVVPEPLITLRPKDGIRVITRRHT